MDITAFKEHETEFTCINIDGITNIGQVNEFESIKELGVRLIHSNIKGSCSSTIRLILKEKPKDALLLFLNAMEDELVPM